MALPLGEARYSSKCVVGAGQCPARGRATSPPLQKILQIYQVCHSEGGEAAPYGIFGQLTRGMVNVNSVLPSRLVTLIFSPWEQTMVFTM